MSAFVRIAALARRFLAWWAGQLLALLPRRARALFGPGARRFVLVGEDEIVLARDGPNGLASIARAARDDPSGLRRLVARAGRRRALAVRLGPTQTLARELTLPLAAERNLDEVVALEMERRSPFAAGEVYLSCRVIARDRDAGTLRLRAVLVPKAQADEALARLAQAGARPARLEAGDGTPLSLPGGKGCRRALVPLLAGLVTILAAVALLLPLHQRQQLAERLEARLAVATAEAEAVASLRADFEALTRAEALPFARKRARPAAVLVVEDLSRRLPDDTWLLHLRLAGEEIEMTGYSSAAAGLIERLELSPLLRDVRFRSPVTRDPRRDAERFHLSATLASEMEAGK